MSFRVATRVTRLASGSTPSQAGTARVRSQGTVAELESFKFESLATTSSPQASGTRSVAGPSESGASAASGSGPRVTEAAPRLRADTGNGRGPGLARSHGPAVATEVTKSSSRPAGGPLH